jgi:chromate transporter
LVFGGGHVVLPLLQESVGDQISTDTFLLGYAAAQAVPGPMFSLASFLGASLHESSPILGATIATIAIFSPGFLLVIALRQQWMALSTHRQISGAITGINASVVGLLIAAFYQPIFTSAITTPLAASCFLLGFFLLSYLRLPIVILVIGYAITGTVLF